MGDIPAAFAFRLLPGKCFLHGCPLEINRLPYGYKRAVQYTRFALALMFMLELVYNSANGIIFLTDHENSDMKKL
ncbi:MAG TPA: hypothetical protein VFR58_06015, partial [Flavisolibacter sp.]|nr:hypothetical protein [Flavisolibacter sp.]